MACVNCGKIRSALLHGKMAEAVGLSVEAFREKFGIGEQATVAEDPVQPDESKADAKTPSKAK